jgi:phage shock protein E
MDWTWIVMIGMVAAFVIMTRVGKITGQRARELVSKGARLIDVRTPGEFSRGHIDGAENVPLDRIGAHAAALLEEERAIVVYCASGMRSASAKRALKAAGAREVYDLGGMSRW